MLSAGEARCRSFVMMGKEKIVVSDVEEAVSSSNLARAL